jgi:hypothetical protein
VRRRFLVWSLLCAALLAGNQWLLLLALSLALATQAWRGFLQ